MGKDDLKKIVKVLADVMNAGSKAIHGQSILSVLWGLSGDYSVIMAIDWAAAKAAVLSLSDSDRREVEAAYTGGLALLNPVVQAKIISGVNLMDNGFQLVEQAVVLEKQAVALFS